MSIMPGVQLIRFGPFELNLESGELLRHGHKVRLQEQSFQLLRVLSERPGQVVTREELQRLLWPSDTFVDFDSGLNNAVKRLRDALGDTAAKPSYVETLPRRGYRFLATPSTVETASTPDPIPPEPFPVQLPESSPEPARAPSQRLTSHSLRWLLAAAALLLLGAGVLILRPHKIHSFTPKDTIVLGEFRNRTSDPVFDETLRQGLAVELQQSPLLSVVGEDRIQKILRMMDKPANTRLEPATAREVCERNASIATVNGTIDALGSAFVLGLRAIDCRTGNIVAEEQAQATRKEDVLSALDAVARDLRTRLGESMSSIETHDKPLAEATTSSLEALKSYSIGVKTFYSGQLVSAIPYFVHATELDPAFAAAWGYMACSCSVEPDLARANITRAYALRERTTERERLFIEATYYEIGTGELDKAITANELWAQLYPRDFEPQKSLAWIYRFVGNSDRAAMWARSATALGDDPLNYLFLATAYLNLNKLPEAQLVYDEMDRKHLVTYGVPRAHYVMAFFAGDPARMRYWASTAVGKPHFEDDTLAAQADTAAWFGRVKQARDLIRQASQSALQANAPETAASYQAYEALFEAEIGNKAQARAGIGAAFKVSPTRNVRQVAPLIMASIGDTAAARKLEAELEKKDSLGTTTKIYFLPAIQAELALQEKDPQRAVQILQGANAGELGFPHMLTAYVRGEAFLKEGNADLAVLEYQKFLDRYGLVRNAPQGALARLGLARAYALKGDVPKARTAYSNFLTLWKDADPGTPILQEARKELARLG